MSTLARIHRRRFLAHSAAAAVCAPAILRAADKPASASSKAASPLPSFDREMEEFMSARNVPGGALAIVKDRKLIYARGYGWADRDKKIAATPESLFRLASIFSSTLGS